MNYDATGSPDRSPSRSLSLSPTHSPLHSLGRSPSQSPYRSPRHSPSRSPNRSPLSLNRSPKRVVGSVDPFQRQTLGQIASPRQPPSPAKLGFTIFADPDRSPPRPFQKSARTPLQDLDSDMITARTKLFTDVMPRSLSPTQQNIENIDPDDVQFKDVAPQSESSAPLDNDNIVQQ